jgi:lipid-A-disaccharide synthase
VRVFFSTGEPSGEYHAVVLAQALRGLTREKLTLEGIGSQRMRDAGFNVWVETRGWASLGWLEAIAKIPPLLAIMLSTAARLRLRAPDLVVLVDFGAFNLRLARQLRRTGYRGPIVYYIPPGAWLDRAHQAQMVAGATTPVTVFEHQRSFYAGLGLKVEFFGHPLVSLIEPRAPRAPAATDGGTIALLPGSRRAEIERHLAPLLSAAQALALERPRLSIRLSAANAEMRALIDARVAQTVGLSISVVDGARTALEDADAACIASGTAVLEAALLGVPSVLFYITSAAQAKMARRMYARMGGRWIGLPNLVLGRGVIPELWQECATPAALAEELHKILNDPAPQLRDLEGLRPALGPPNALERIATFVLEQAQL